MVAAALLCVLAACAPPPAADPEPADHETSPMPRTSDTPLDRATDIAVADLAERLGIDPGAVDVQSARAVTWPDGSLGCPQPDRFYTQALVEGFALVLRAAGEQYHYHAGRDGDPFWCPDERRRAPVDDGRASF